jgi:hypothetical protein
MIATRNADVESHAAVVEEQTRMLAAQAAKIETLLREEEQTRLLAAQAANIEILLREADGRQPVVEPPATEAVTRGAAPARQAASAATAAAAEAPAARPPAPAAATEPVARSAEAPRAPEPAPAQEGPAKRERTAQAEPTRAGSPPPRESGSGMCDVPPGKDAARSMRRCIDWFNGVDSSATRPSK